MFYKLLPQYLLRGWDKLPYAVVNTDNGDVTFVSKDEFSVLDMCNGQADLSLPLFTDHQRDIAKKFADYNVIAACSYGDKISPEQAYLLYPNRFITRALWSITGKCNYKCKHCCMSASDGLLGEMSHEDIMRLIDEFNKCGIFKVQLTGGEPLIRSDFLEIVDELTKHHIHIEIIYSNGLLVSEKLLLALRDRGVNPEFNMSFDGTEGWHDWLRGVDKATEVIDRAFRLCREYGFSTASEMCIHEKNKHTLRDSVNYLASLGCREIKTNPITDLGSWHEGGFGESISIKDLYDLYLDYIPKYYEDSHPINVMLGGFFHGSGKTGNYIIPSYKPASDPNIACVCGHARNTMYISPEGRALPCFSLSGMDIQHDYPLILDKGLANCLTDSKYMSLIDTKVSHVLNHNERCKGCEYAPNCHSGCRASALTTTPQDIFGIDEAVCTLFKGGYIDKIKKTVEKAGL